MQNDQLELRDWHSILKKSLETNKQKTNITYLSLLSFVKKYSPTIIVNSDNNFLFLLERFPFHFSASILQLHSVSKSFIEIAKTFDKTYDYCFKKGYTHIYSMQTKNRSEKYTVLMKRYSSIFEKYSNSIDIVIPKNTIPKDEWMWFLLGQQTHNEDYVLKQTISLQFRTV